MRTAQLRRPNGGDRRSCTARDWNASFAPQISLLFSPKSWFLVTGVCRNKHNLPQLDRSFETLEVTAGKHLSTLVVAILVLPSNASSCCVPFVGCLHRSKLIGNGWKINHVRSIAVELRPYRASWLSADGNCPYLSTCTSAECIALFASAFPFLLLYFRWPF
jgi:hypothetical protein